MIKLSVYRELDYLQSRAKSLYNPVHFLQGFVFDSHQYPLRHRNAPTGATDTGAASNTYWSHSLELLTTATVVNREATRNHRSDRYWSCERQILELRATDTGAASDSYWSLEQLLDLQHRRAQLILEPLAINERQPRTTATGALNVSRASH